MMFNVACSSFPIGNRMRRMGALSIGVSALLIMQACAASEGGTEGNGAGSGTATASSGGAGVAIQIQAQAQAQAAT